MRASTHARPRRAQLPRRPKSPIHAFTIARNPQTLARLHAQPRPVLTSYSGHEDFVSKMYDLGARTFMSKPLRGHCERFLEKTRVALERGKRADHADCAAHVESTPAEPGEGALVSPGGGLAARIGAKTFEEIGLRVVDGHTVRVTCKRRHVTATYIDLAFATRRRTPTREWELLLDICDNHGTFRWKRYGDFNAARQRVFVLRTKLKAAFGIDGDPFHKFRVVDGWRPKFRATSDRTDGSV